MENTEVEKGNSSEETSQLNRNRSFKSKQLVRSQAIRESQSPPRALSPAQRNNNSPTIASVESPPPSVGYTAPTVASSSPKLASSTPSVEGDRTVSFDNSDDSSHINVRCSDVIKSSDVKISDSDNYKKKQPVEIQITSGGWDESQCLQRQRARRWLSDAGRDLLSNNPRVACVCGTCAACPHCRGRRRRHACPTKQDSGIVCSDDCADCDDDTAGNNNNEVIRKSNSLDVDEQMYYCRCPERKERIKNVSLTRNDSDDRNEISGPELVAFLKDTLNKNPRDRLQLLKIEKELHALVNDTGRCIVRFPVMTSYGRMLVHRCAALFQLSHHLDQINKTSVLVSKSGTSGGRIPCTSFKEWCTASFPPSPQRHQPDATHAKSILKRDTHSLDEPGTGALANNRSKSLEQREKEYERVRRRIFSTEEQWPWLSGPVKVLTPEGGRNKLLKVQSLESRDGPPAWRGRGAVSKSHSFGGYAGTEPHQPRLLSRQGDLASSSWRLSPSSSGYKTLSLRSTDSITPSPTGGASPEPALCEGAPVVWAVTDMSAVPPGAVVIHPQTGRPLTNPDGSVYHFDPDNPPILYDPGLSQNDQQKMDQNEKRRGRLEKQHSFIDNDCECQPSEECRNKCCCECRRHEACQQRTTSEKETNTGTIPPAPTRYESNTQTNAQETQHATNQKPEHEPTNQRPPVYEATNQKPPFEAQRSFETNQRPGSASLNNRPANVANQEVQDIQYQQYTQGYRTDEVTSPPQMSHQYVSPEVTMQAKVTPVHMPDPNIRPMSLTNMTNLVYPTVAQGYPYPCRVEPHLQMYPQMVQAEEPKIAPSPLTNETAFRIDPSYPYAGVEYGACGACVDSSGLQQQPRSYSVPFGQVEVPQAVMQPYPVGNVILPQPHLQPYPYQEPLPWAGVAPAPKIVMPELYHPIMPYPQPAYQHYNIVYPQVIPQPYPLCQPVYPVLEKPQEFQRRNSFTGNRSSKRNSVSNSARNTPLQEEKVPYDDKQRQNPETSNRQTNSAELINRQNSEILNRQNSEALNRQNSETLSRPNSENMIRQNSEIVTRQNTEIAAKIQHIKNQMAQLNTRDRDKNRNEWRRRNSGNGLLGNFPVNSFNGRLMGRANEDAHLTSAARAIVNSIRNMQAKNTYQDTRRDYQQRYEHKDRPDFRRRDREENNETERYDARARGMNPPVYRQPYLFRQDVEEQLFNFIPMEDPIAQKKPGQKSLGLSRKRQRTDQTFFQYIKKPVTRGTKIIKIEIYDAENFPKSEQPMCNCEADVCVQHVVKAILFDDIYSTTRELIAKIQDDIEPKA